MDPLAALLQTIKTLLHETLPSDIAHSITKGIESKVEEMLKNFSLVPRHEFENLGSLVTALETKISYLEQRLAEIEKTGALSPETLDEN